MNNGKHGQGTQCTKMGADSAAENTPNAPEFICPICPPKPKSSGFKWKKASLGIRSPWAQRYESKTVWLSLFHWSFKTSTELAPTMKKKRNTEKYTESQKSKLRKYYRINVDETYFFSPGPANISQSKCIFYKCLWVFKQNFCNLFKY